MSFHNNVSIHHLVASLTLLFGTGLLMPHSLEGGENDLPNEPVVSDGDTGSTTFPVRFHVDGNRIVDPSGNPRTLRGVVAMDPIVQAWPGNPDEGSWNEDYYIEMAKWGAEIVRVQVHPNTWRQDKAKAIEIVEQTVEWIGKHGMYVILDWHSIGFVPTGFFGDLGHRQDLLKTTEEEMTEFWVQFAKHFADNDVVAFYEIFNEPVTSRGQQINTRDEWILWRDMQERFVDAIREVDDHTPIICSGLDYTFDLSYIPSDPVRRENIVYAVHIYPFRDVRKHDWDKRIGKAADHYPVFCTEWGFVTDPKHPHASYGLETVYGPDGAFRREVVDYLEARHMSWTAWCFSASTNGPNLLKDWNLTPSDSGVFVRETLQSQ